MFSAGPRTMVRTVASSVMGLHRYSGVANRRAVGLHRVQARAAPIVDLTCLETYPFRDTWASSIASPRSCGTLRPKRLCQNPMCAILF